jgi:RHS repeat-associated protein
MLDEGMGGIMDYKARFYSVALGRFIQPDSIIPDQSNPQSWNRFGYVINNPLNLTDPTGHWYCNLDPDECEFLAEHSNEPVISTGDSSNPSNNGNDQDDRDIDVEIIFNDMADESDIAFNYPIDGCYARAHLMSQRIEQRYGVTVYKVWIFGPLRVSTEGPWGEVGWRYHVAPVVWTALPGRSGVPMVIDPSIADRPVAIEEWKAIMHASDLTVQVLPLGQAPRYPPNTGEVLPGSGYWPGPDPNYPGGLDGHAAATMQVYSGCVPGGPCIPP